MNKETVKMFNKGKSSIKTIENVLYMKDLKCNLMSVRRLTRLGYKVVFEGDDAIVSKNGKVVFIARAERDMYQVEFNIERDIFAGIKFKQCKSKFMAFSFGTHQCI